jgi:UDP-N-acetyl-D-glucosamine dehydrogenase
VNPIAKKLFSDIQAKKAKIAILGLGYVGLPLAMAFVKKGFHLTGIDLDRERTGKLRRGQSYIEDVPAREIRQALEGGRLEASENCELLAEADVIIICVPTPLNRVKDPDLSFIISATEAIRAHLRAGQLVILESTTYPGTTEEVVLPVLGRSGLRVGQDFFLCFSPERIDPGNKKFPLQKITKVVGGITPTCTRLGAALYGKVMQEVVTVSSARTAEMAKLLENTFRIVNIGLVNELAQVADALGVNIWEAIDAASTKPFGFMPFYPGPGIGGHCIGIDPVYLSWKARMHGADIHFIELARRINAEMPRFIAERAVVALNSRAHKAVSKSKILILGVSYKRDVSDTRESPAFEIMERLENLGAKVSYHDPYVPVVKNETHGMRSVRLTRQNLQKMDLVIITTDHSGVDYGRVAKYAPLIFDTRNIQHASFKSSKIVRL